MAKGPLAVWVEIPNNTGYETQWTVADATSISKGILLSFADPATASEPGATAYGVFAGVSTSEKRANDGSTTIGAQQWGIIDVRASNAITAGDKVLLAGNNEVISAVYALANAPATVSQALFTKACIVGTARETATDQEVIEVDIGNR